MRLVTNRYFMLVFDQVILDINRSHVKTKDFEVAAML